MYSLHEYDYLLKIEYIRNDIKIAKLTPLSSDVNWLVESKNEISKQESICG